jgi:RNA polymerase sigma factor
LVRAYTGFALRVAGSCCGRFVQAGRDEEASIALLALNEAIDAYDPSQGVEFPSFLATVVKRRLIDWFRRESRRREVPLSQLESDAAGGAYATAVEALGAVAVHRVRLEEEERRSEIESYGKDLAGYGITWRELVRVSPKHRDAREQAMAIARTIVQDPGMIRYLRERRELPLRALEERVSVSRKTLERQRKYVIAMTLILLGDYSYLREYLKLPPGGG